MTTPVNTSVSYVDPDPNAIPGQAPTANAVGERFASLTPAQRAAAGVRSENGYEVQAANPVNEPNVSKPANQRIPR